MALTTRTNGSTSGNIIQASWFNDFKDLLTGVMTTQPVTIANTVTVSGLLTASAGVTIAAGGLTVIGTTTFSSGFTIPNAILLTLAATTGVSATMYCNASNDFIIHAGNSNKVSIVSNSSIAQLIVDAGASLITAVPKIQANGGIAFAGGTGITRFSSAIAAGTTGTFNHGLGATPTGAYVTGYGSGPGYYSTDTYTSTQFKLYAAGTVNWQAIVLI